MLDRKQIRSSQLPLALSVLLGSFLCLPASSWAVPILLGASATYGESADNDNTGDLFTLLNTSDPGVQITGITLTLASPLLFDTAGGGAGQSPASAFVATAGLPAGGTYTLGGGSVSDGATSLSISFTGFDPGETFSFRIDVDDTSGSSPGTRRTVTGNEFAGSTISFLFAGPFVGSPSSLGGTFARTGEHTAGASVSGQAEAIAAVPEPASLTLFGLGALGAALVGGRRRRQA